MMVIEITTTWRPGPRIWWPGRYRVPQDMPMDVYKKAVEAGVVELVEDSTPTPEAQPEPTARKAPKNRARKPPETKA